MTTVVVSRIIACTRHTNIHETYDVSCGPKVILKFITYIEMDIIGRVLELVCYTNFDA